MYECIFCNYMFTKKSNFERHLKKNCQEFNLMNAYDVYKLFINKKEEVKDVKVNPILELNINYISVDDMIVLVDKYDDDLSFSNLKYLLLKYINNILCNKEFKENYAIKYTRKKPATYYISYTENLHFIKNLKDTCELLCNPILNILLDKFNEFMYVVLRDPDYDMSLYEDTIEKLRITLNRDTIMIVLKNFLKNNILNNNEMKCKLTNVN